MATGNISRRDVLRSTGVGAVGVLGVSDAAAGGPDRYVVGTSGTSGFRAATSRAEVVHRVLDFGSIGRAVAGNYSAQAIDSLRERDDVRYVERDATVHAIATPDDPANGNGHGHGGNGSTSQTLPWGIDRVDADVAHSNGDTGNGADVAIIDTGIDDDHPDLEANVGSGTAFVDCRGWNCNYDWSDDNGHGTHCAGIATAVNNTRGVVGVSTSATLHAVKVLDKRGSGHLSDVAAGIEYTADQNWDVGSMSLGASTGGQTLQDACRYAYDRGVLLVAAAGNAGPCSDCVGYPAAYDTVVAVSATTETDALATFSSTGPAVELAAPGASVYSTVIGGYDTFSGTSMACPHVSGAGAMLMAGGYSNAGARDRLTDTAEDVGLTENEAGAGLLDVAAAAGYDSSDST